MIGFDNPYLSKPNDFLAGDPDDSWIFYISLDTETTGLPARDHQPLSLALLNRAGQVLLHTLLRPVRRTRWPEAERVHGIRPDQVLRAGVPTLAELTPPLADLVRGQHLVIYNAACDTQILAPVLALGPPAQIHCLLEEFTAFYGEWHPEGRALRRQRLAVAAAYVLHEWQGPAHSALADTHAARAV
ncbi:3'-5' exonuclease [Hymenobacter sp. NST-14]|uniref:3'-5' exonuclease n=1 Tax=Hymenobacter piscis TaxID=2839984 RepID=UPI001C03717B|nr:3'-5' exonuclease [Hymenobacter piscis]MBT9394927.1 3'-5' exonuclease [Hymenobacter piscis]